MGNVRYVAGLYSSPGQYLGVGQLEKVNVCSTPSENSEENSGTLRDTNSVTDYLKS